MNLFKRIISYLFENWGATALSLILLTVIVLNFKPGYFILGNDNFSPELNPSLTFERSIFSPGWRSYRVLGIPSDSEQADIFRTGIFWILEKALPAWLVSQGYLFFTFFIASFSIGALTSILTFKLFNNYRKLSFLLGGIFYMANLLTSWIYFFPVHLFVAAYAFLPLVLWRMACFFQKRTIPNALILLFSSLLLSTAALTATMFFICAIVIAGFTFTLFILERQNETSKPGAAFKTAMLSVFLTLIIQLFWFLPFVTYVSTNTKDLQESSTYRNINATTIESEVKFNTAFNSLRYFSSWIDTRENKVSYTFSYRNWYKDSTEARVLSLLPIVLALIGSLLIFKRRRGMFFIPLFALTGWFLIKGANPPFGFVYGFLQDNSAVFAQVFRWQSSKFWPLMAVNIPILATLGTLFVFDKISNFKPWSRAKSEGFQISNFKYIRIISLLKIINRRTVPVIFLLLIVFSSLYYVHPYFKGELVRKNVFLNVPKEYFDLADYLNKNDKLSRIYLAPEANTLYFRNYNWGFWGSVFLNYVLPNPIVEKALVTGSNQNEQAFNVLSNAYHSQDPKIFVSALERYDVSLVLSDKNATHGDVGYVYNWETHKKVVEDNPEFEKIFSSGKIALYKLKEKPEKSIKIERLSFQHDFTKLNKIFAMLHDTRQYYSDENSSGTIYPFALNFDSLKFYTNEIIADTKYKGEKISYKLSTKNLDINQAPTQVNFDPVSGSIIFTPLLPTLTINHTDYVFRLPSKRYTTEVAPYFVTLDDRVVDLRNNNSRKNTDISYEYLEQYVSAKSWTEESEAFNLLNPDNKMLFTCNNKTNISDFNIGREKTLCASPDLIANKDTITELEIGLKSAKPIKAVLCLQSRFTGSCLNKNTSAFINGEVKPFKMLLPRVLPEGDTLKIFLELNSVEEESVNVSVQRMALNIYQDSYLAEFADQDQSFMKQEFNVPIHKNDNISLHIPYINSPHHLYLSPENIFTPDTSISYLDKSYGPSNKIKEVKNGGLEFVNKEGNGSLFPRIEMLDPNNNLAMTAITGKHFSGIPLTLSMRTMNEQNRLWERELYYKKPTTALDLTFLPDEIQSYYLEAFSTSFNQRVSRNLLGDFAFQIIPKSWFLLKLIPNNNSQLELSQLEFSNARETNSYSGVIRSLDSLRSLEMTNKKIETTRIVSIPTAFSPFWNLEINGKDEKEKVLINGWKQGWATKNSGVANVDFFPNKLIYIGFLLVAGTIVWMVFRIVKGFFQTGGSKRNASKSFTINLLGRILTTANWHKLLKMLKKVGL